ATVRLAVLANDRDADRDRLRVTAVGAARSGRTALSSGMVLYRPNAGFAGTDTFTYTVSDGRGGTATGTVTARAVNRAPRAVTDKVATTRGVPLTVAVLGNDTDVDGDALTITSVGRAKRGTVAVVDGSVVYTPVGTFTGTDSFTYRVTDGRGGNATGLVTVRVSAPSTTRR
ncbi:MAG: cadherin-like domain-containing protein, partial [Actinomycetota bacterium]|nr:cadherin-like domain-containing protein [Actinomycetota bacterium]